VVSVAFFYLLVKKVSNQNSALFAAGVYTLAPLSIFCGRSFVPDMASLSLSIIALYLFAEWLERERNLWLLAITSMATSLAILVKLPAIILGLPLVYMAWTSGEYGSYLCRNYGYSLLYPSRSHSSRILMRISSVSRIFVITCSVAKTSRDKESEFVWGDFTPKQRPPAYGFSSIRGKTQRATSQRSRSYWKDYEEYSQ